MPKKSNDQTSRRSLGGYGPSSQSQYVSMKDIESQQPGILTYIGSSFPNTNDPFLNHVGDPLIGVPLDGATLQRPTIQIDRSYTGTHPHQQPQQPDFLQYSSQGTNTSYADSFYLASDNGGMGGSSVRSSGTWDHKEADNTVPAAAGSGRGEQTSRLELPDFFYAHKPDRYHNYKHDCSRAYSDFHGFVRNSLKKHYSRGHMEHEDISDEQYERALQVKNPTSGRSMSLDDKHREHWKLVRRALFGTPTEVSIPECEDMGKHDACKAKRTDREKKHRAGRSIGARTSGGGTSPARSVVSHSNFNFQPASRAATEAQHQNSLLPPNLSGQPHSPIFRPRQQLLHIANRSFPPTGYGPPSSNVVPTQSFGATDRAHIRQAIKSTFDSLIQMESRFWQDISSHREHIPKLKDVVNQVTAIVEDFRSSITGARTSSTASMFGQQPLQHAGTTTYLSPSNTAYPITQGMRYMPISTSNQTTQWPETTRETNRDKRPHQNYFMHGFS